MADFGYTHWLQDTDKATAVYLFLLLDETELSWQGYPDSKLHVGCNPRTPEEAATFLEQFGGELSVWDDRDPDNAGADARIKRATNGTWTVDVTEAGLWDAVALSAEGAIAIAHKEIRAVEDARQAPPDV